MMGRSCISGIPRKNFSNSMRFRDSLRTALLGVRHARLRSALTMLGIVIGIASVILLMSLGDSAQKLILGQIKGIGSNLVFVVPGANKSSRFAPPPSVQGIVIKTLTERDLEALRREPSILRAAAEVHGQARAIYLQNDVSVVYGGYPEEFFSIINLEFSKGRAFTKEEVDSFGRVAVMGSNIAKTLFGEMDPIGKSFRLNTISFTVVGILKEKGSGPLGVNYDDLVAVPITVAQKQLLGINYYNASIFMEADSAYNTDYVKSRVTSILRQTHSITDPNKDDFTVRSQEDIVSLLGDITSILTMFLTSIAFISLVVGGIGIMNIMLVSVVERTKEIGLRKAVGATDKDILTQFLWESVILTSAGGIGGILIGGGLVVAIYFALSRFLSTGWVFSLPPNAILLSVAVATFTGVVFGLYPARQASKKSPIEALRYE